MVKSCEIDITPIMTSFQLILLAIVNKNNFTNITCIPLFTIMDNVNFFWFVKHNPPHAGVDPGIQFRVGTF